MGPGDIRENECEVQSRGTGGETRRPEVEWKKMNFTRRKVGMGSGPSKSPFIGNLKSSL